jgi:hypothetical protein
MFVSMKGELYDHPKVAELIKDYCKEHDIRESEYATLIGVHASHLPRIKKGEMCSPEVLHKIAALAKMSVKELLLDTPDSLKDQINQTARQNKIPVCV